VEGWKGDCWSEIEMQMNAPIDTRDDIWPDEVSESVRSNMHMRIDKLLISQGENRTIPYLLCILVDRERRRQREGKNDWVVAGALSRRERIRRWTTTRFPPSVSLSFPEPECCLCANSISGE
jgi:hypothetical protein